jgi:hypothetical protein
VAKRHDVDFQTAGAAKRLRAAVECGASRENVINQEVMLRGTYGYAVRECKGIFEVQLTRSPVVMCLRDRINHAL